MVRVLSVCGSGFFVCAVRFFGEVFGAGVDFLLGLVKGLGKNWRC